jgi:hypothetical protein
MSKFIGILIVLVLTLVLCVLMIGTIFYFKKGWFRKFYHDVMGWHTPNNNLHKFDGCSFHNICKHCGKEIMQDSQGNWF